MISQREYEQHSAGQSQCELILARLALTPGEWVPMPELAEHSGAYAVHSRISDLRKNGHNIEHKNEWEDRTCKSSYRLIPKVQTATQEKLL